LIFVGAYAWRSAAAELKAVPAAATSGEPLRLWIFVTAAQNFVASLPEPPATLPDPEGPQHKDGPYFLGQFLLTQTVTVARVAGLTVEAAGSVLVFKAFPAASVTSA